MNNANSAPLRDKIAESRIDSAGCAVDSKLDSALDSKLDSAGDSAFVIKAPIVRVNINFAESRLDSAKIAHFAESSAESALDSANMDDFVIKEERVSFYLNGTKIISTMCLPCDQDAHILGFLFNEGVIESYKDVRSIKVARDGLRVFIEAKINEENIANLYHEKTLTSGCCVGAVSYTHLTLPTKRIV